MTAEKARDQSAPAPSPAGDLNALLGRGSEFDGKLAFEGTVRIDGTFTGEITTSDTLIVGDGAHVNAEIACGTIVVHGEVNGNIRASQAVELHKPARVKGDIATPSLMIERGVSFNGRSSRSSPAGPWGWRRSGRPSARTPRQSRTCMSRICCARASCSGRRAAGSRPSARTATSGSRLPAGRPSGIAASRATTQRPSLGYRAG